MLLHICPAARLAQTSASPSPLQSHPPTSPNTRQPELLFKNTVTPQASPHQLHTLYNALIALSKVQGQQDLSLGGPSLPFSVHPIFNSPKTCPVWNPYQVEKEKKGILGGRDCSELGRSLHIQRGWDGPKEPRSWEQGLPLSQLHDIYPILQPRWTPHPMGPLPVSFPLSRMPNSKCLPSLIPSQASKIFSAQLWAIL